MSVPDGLEFDTPYTMEEVSEAFGRQDKKEKGLTEEHIVDQEEVNEEYFRDLEEYLNYTQENEPIDDLTYPKFVEKHYPKKENLDIDEDRMNIIGQNGNDGLHYNEKDIPLDRLTDTTQTLIVDRQEETRVIKSNEDLKEEELIELSKEVGKNEVIEDIKPINPTEKDLEKLAQALNISKKEEDDDKRTLRYKGR
jgi:CxxC motif-containing protein